MKIDPNRYEDLDELDEDVDRELMKKETKEKNKKVFERNTRRMTKK
jgi:hypothetical protein